jgi:hypothetical protein
MNLVCPVTSRQEELTCMTRRVINMRQLLFAALVVHLPHNPDMSNDEQEWLWLPP